MVLLTRETARRVVHFINFTRNAVTRFPETLKKTQYMMMRQLVEITKTLAELIRTRPITTRVSREVEAFKDKISGLYDEVQNYATNRLVNIPETATGSAQSLALVPYLLSNSTISQSPTNDDYLNCLSTTNSTSPKIHLHFQLSVHSVISAVSGWTGQRLSMEFNWNFVSSISCRKDWPSTCLDG